MQVLELFLRESSADLPVAEEACLAAELMGSRVTGLTDVGVAGLHRVMDVLLGVQEAKVIILGAGMEAALVSVVAGLVPVPVVEVPTPAWGMAPASMVWRRCWGYLAAALPVQPWSTSTMGLAPDTSRSRSCERAIRLPTQKPPD